jgi:phosphohistidine phosphatase SixA
MIDKAQLWLVRHGKAGGKLDTNTEAQDFARTLSPNGIAQSQRAGQLLSKIAPAFDALYCSPRQRCVQTANLMAPLIGVDAELKQRLDETIEAHPKRVLGLVKDGGAVLMVGHGPEWQAVIGKLTGRDVWLSCGGLCAICIVDGQASISQLLGAADVERML